MKLLAFRKYTAAALSAVFGVFVMTAAGLCAGAAETGEVLPSQLYARCAVLMDAGTGRILFEKNGNEEAVSYTHLDVYKRQCLPFSVR